MVLAHKTRLANDLRAGRRRCRRACGRPLEERHCADVISFPKPPVCDTYEKERKWAVCGQNNVPAKEIHIRQMEEVLIHLSKQDSNLGVAVLRADKKSLNALNKTGGKHGAGDSCLALYMGVLEQAVRSTFPAARRIYLVRDSGSSDETFIVVAGEMEMLKSAAISFGKIYEKTVSSSMKKLSRYRYTENKLIGQEGVQRVQPTKLDLARFSRALQKPDIVAKAHISGPKLIPGKEFGSGFISRALDELGRKEAVQSNLLPPSFSPIFINNPGISPFINRLPASGFLPPGSVVLEMKFRHSSESDKWAAFDFLEKTGKGVAEILSGRFGLRYINTFMGEAAADHIIAATALAMKDLEVEMNCRVMRTDSKLMYVVEGLDTEILIKKVRELAKLRIGPVFGSDAASFTPSPRAIFADSLHANDLRAHMALDAMHLDLPTEALTYLDLMVSAAKELRPEVVSRALNNGTPPDFTQQAGKVFNMIYGAVLQNPAVRDAEDMVYSIRSGLMVAEKGAEEKIWDFAIRWGKELRNRLLEVFERL